MGLKVHQNGVKLTNSLEWWSVVASVRQSLHRLDGPIERNYEWKLCKTTFANID